MTSTPPSNKYISEAQTDTHDICVLSQALKACGDPLRLQVLQVLRYETFGVLELTQIFETKQSGMSHHLKVLSQSGLVEAQREGNAVFYRRPLSHETKESKLLTSSLFNLVDQLSLDDRLTVKIKNIQEQRAAQSQAFFTKNAVRFHEQQELIAQHSLYSKSSFELLTLPESSSNSSSLSEQTVMEVGPGEGHFLESLCRTYKHVIALDNSQSMLSQAKAYCQELNITNIDFELGDTETYRQTCLKSKEHRVDAVVMNMVLHHVPAPSKLFMDIYEILKPGGSLVVCDLARHNQEWTKESCGDLWLGFELEELQRWARLSGLYEEQNALIGLRNGFQIQLCKFTKPINP